MVTLIRCPSYYICASWNNNNNGTIGKSYYFMYVAQILSMKTSSMDSFVCCITTKHIKKNNGHGFLFLAAFPHNKTMWITKKQGNEDNEIDKWRLWGHKIWVGNKFRFNCTIVNMLQFRVLHFGRSWRTGLMVPWTVNNTFQFFIVICLFDVLQSNPMMMSHVHVITPI
jgi:hypothetical protein